jgi:DNA-binding NarL/FixJ family response regulator
MADIRVCIIEDHKETRQGLEQLINFSQGFTVVGTFANADNIVKQIERCQPDIIFMDIQLPGISGIEAVILLRQHFPSIKIVMQTIFENDDKIFASICAGASGYILKSTPPAKYLEAIQEAFNGGAPITPGIALRVLSIFKKLAEAPPKQAYMELSEREKEMLQYLVNGLSYKQIASNCNITYDTVRFHIKNIYSKLHVSSTAEAVAKAIQQRII